MSIAKLCQSIELIVSDVDGVLTDGSIIFNNAGIETKQFFVRDGFGIRLWKRGGGKFGIVTARSSHIVSLRAAELEIEIVRQGTEQKLGVLKEILTEMHIGPEHCCYIGDDLPDLSVVQYAGLGVAVADATAEVREAADYVTQAPGGRGAVRETIEMILKAQHRWDESIHAYKL